MYEGTLVWHEDSIAVQHFSHGELIFTKLQIGQEIELFAIGTKSKFILRRTSHILRIGLTAIV